MIGRARSLFEVVPPRRSSSPDYRKKVMDSMISAISASNSIDMVNIPEIVEENWRGNPYYRTELPCCFGQELRKNTGKEVIVNKAVAHCKDKEQFTDWLDHAVEVNEIRNFIFVGGNNSSNQYSGPSVIEANEIALRKHDISVGNILIPSRSNESKRLLQKTIAGASFFTTQVLFSIQPLTSILESYSSECNQMGLDVGKIFLSFTPVCKPDDLIFMKWLGAHVPSDVEDLLVDDSKSALDKSFDLAHDLLTKASEFVTKSENPVLIGVNIEEIFIHNFKAAIELSQSISRHLPQSNNRIEMSTT